jgi:hypothetical protein
VDACVDDGDVVVGRGSRYDGGGGIDESDALSFSFYENES